MGGRPLPVREGVGPTRLRLPSAGPWPDVYSYVVQHFSHISAEELTRRFRCGEIVDASGRHVDAVTPLGELSEIWYYRALPEEVPLPVVETIIYQDEHLVAADKPHYMATTPGGKYLQESLLVRLRNRLGLEDLTPLHRLDRATAGVVLFAVNPAERGRYQSLFERGKVAKKYESMSHFPDAARENIQFPLRYSNRMVKRKGELLSTVVAGEVNAHTDIELLSTFDNTAGERCAHLALTPLTGKTHQLRVHLAALGMGIIGDRFYPELLPEKPDDYRNPLQLLAKEISFTDPITAVPRHFVSNSSLVLRSAVIG